MSRGPVAQNARHQSIESKSNQAIGVIQTTKELQSRQAPARATSSTFAKEYARGVHRGGVRSQELRTMGRELSNI